MDCIICLTESDKGYTCCCSSFTCNNCCESFINFSKKEINSLPSCPNQKCNQFYYFYNTKIIPTESLTDYSNLLFNFLKNGNIDKLTVIKANKNILDNVRYERRKFIDSLKYKAVSEFINIAFKTKLDRINKSNIKFIDSIENKKKCFNVICNRGFLDNSGKCNICSTKFCEKCEQKKLENHKCNPHDLSSVGFKNDMVKCPKCNISIEKSFGCMHMQCSICKCKFNYLSGKIDNIGNPHNKEINLNTNYSLSKDLQHIYKQDIISLLVKIESLQPQVSSFDNILKKIDKIIESKDQEKEKILLCKSYYLYQKKLQKNQFFYDCLKDIQNKRNALSIEFLEKIIQLLEA